MRKPPPHPFAVKCTGVIYCALDTTWGFGEGQFDSRVKHPCCRIASAYIIDILYFVAIATRDASDENNRCELDTTWGFGEDQFWLTTETSITIRNDISLRSNGSIYYCFSCLNCGLSLHIYIVATRDVLDDNNRLTSKTSITVRNNISLRSNGSIYYCFSCLVASAYTYILYQQEMFQMITTDGILDNDDDM